MSIRMKLILTYLGMLFISVLLVIIIGIGAFSGAVGTFLEIVLNGKSFEEVSNNGVDLMVDLRYTENNAPKTLDDEAFQAKIASDLKPFKGFLVVESGGQFKVLGNQMPADPELFKAIKASTLELDETADVSDRARMKHLVKWNQLSYLIIPYDFPKVAGDLVYYLALDVTHVKKTGNSVGYGFLIGFIFITGLVVAPIIWITSIDIIKPLKQLELGSQRIAEGDLNFRLKANNRNEVGRVVRSFEVMRSELKKSIDSKLEVEQNRKELIANMSHDLKTPITAIKGYVEGIRDGVADSPEKLDRYLETIYVKSLDMDRMIDDLFLFSKLDLKNETFDKEVLSIQAFCESCMAELHMQYDSKGIQLLGKCQLEPEARVMMDSQKIKRVILNIVNNAIKYMDKPSKELTFEFAQTESDFSVKITDNGLGIDEKNLARIFERFYTVDPSRNQDVGGTGLGLAIAKEIIEQQGGTIKASSEKGVFTTIEFKLPLMKEEKPNQLG